MPLAILISAYLRQRPVLLATAWCFALCSSTLAEPDVVTFTAPNAGQIKKVKIHEGEDVFSGQEIMSVKYEDGTVAAIRAADAGGRVSRLHESVHYSDTRWGKFAAGDTLVEIGLALEKDGCVDQFVYHGFYEGVGMSLEHGRSQRIG